jgi:hypothetical protein
MLARAVLEPHDGSPIVLDVPERIARRLRPVEPVLRAPRASWRAGWRRAAITGIELRRVRIDARSS